VGKTSCGLEGVSQGAGVGLLANKEPNYSTEYTMMKLCAGYLNSPPQLHNAFCYKLHSIINMAIH